ncbi:Glucosyl-3-phosphoglycerate synthase [bacterium HR17]|jgi:glycosyltransferase involved in cell wall biosynthesis|uniref:Glucosyl-3-phosphoglycerate synthase n=1 Tax=Candidatus Fervidibacter japonicus TaxID=2035412 RepID=A0A2H5XFY5_9BACT|nr:Glucosyl-3-phosphoglycerate synthase [bacterium HR17]
MPQLSILIPAHNESDRIGATVTAIRHVAEHSGLTWELIVVDDGSTDGTADIAQAAGATKVVRLRQRRGKGAALRRGLAEATGEIVLLVDADLGDDAASLGALLRPLLDGVADMAIAAPPPDPHGGGFGIVKTFSAWAIRTLTGFQPTAPLSGQRAVRRTVLERITLADGYGVETALTIDTLWAGVRVVEVPIGFRHRALGKSWQGFWHRAKQLRDIVCALLPRLARFTAQILRRKLYRRKGGE